MSARALETLNCCDYVASEDTRNTGKLLSLLGIKKPLISIHQHSNEAKIKDVISDLEKGKNICYVSDAGTPNLSDPGGKLVEQAFLHNIEVSPIPGASALTTLISVAPFDCSRFIFLGFFPKKKGRVTMIKTIQNQEYPVFFFESCHRIKKTLQLLSENLPEYHILIGRELTKKFEQILYLKLTDKEALAALSEKGEFALGLVKTRGI